MKKAEQEEWRVREKVGWTSISGKKNDVGSMPGAISAGNKRNKSGCGAKSETANGFGTTFAG
jgi:hypothetical protein